MIFTKLCRKFPINYEHCSILAIRLQDDFPWILEAQIVHKHVHVPMVQKVQKTVEAIRGVGANQDTIQHHLFGAGDTVVDTKLCQTLVSWWNEKSSLNVMLLVLNQELGCKF